ncbi:exonuclease subunit SbcD [Rhodoferax antarcticus]|uniref:Nuclease SbcCD subunit D n=1 Tax=Rhodoferax antarcticus ANT.BR TaxID=1111071 RepID=A0A1Q8YHQ2_9BURK|nr:exonuclease subunit SbcD [Rhodoferax antarcticus]APW45253.1 exonuclease subunit SbcD [Rhodoferax antarcticus]OLP07526.1 exonuclease sbcCD subunit D [Rhodoferax antarcticus ANT.BR]
MRILHTSDWHLGQHFMGKSRQAEHQALIDWLLVQVEAHAVGAVLIAGDIFDTGAPPSYARELYSHLVVGLHRAGVALLLLGGNHDSVATLRESRSLLAFLSTTVVADVNNPADQLVVLPRRGTSAEPGCIVCAVPFIRARDVLQSQAGQSAQEKQQSMQVAIQAYYQAVYAAGQARQAELQRELGRSVPLIATGHLTTVGASSNESVREIYVGSLDAFPTAAFPPADYIALGHIHKPQKVGGVEHIRYCGSPIALGFDEARQQKEMLLVELDERGLVSVTALPVPRFQSLVSVSANLATLAGAIATAAAKGTFEKPVWLEVTVAEDDYLSDLPARISEMTQGLPVEVLRVRRQRANTAGTLDGDILETLDELSPEDVFARRLAQEDLPPAMQEALGQRFREVVKSITEGAV